MAEKEVGEEAKAAGAKETGGKAQSRSDIKSRCRAQSQQASFADMQIAVAGLRLGSRGARAVALCCPYISVSSLRDVGSTQGIGR